MTHDEWYRRLIDAGRDYNDPPATPREEMWAVVRETLDPQAEGPGRVTSREAGGRARLRLGPGPRWTPWALGLAAAATLVVGFGLGRVTRPALETPPEVVIGGDLMRDNSLPVRLAASSHLGEAEALLTLYRTTRATDDRAATAQWARDLLSTTRLLMDSRAAREPEMAQLLADLELVLVQIANAATDPAEQEMIEDGIAERQLLAKLRAVAVPTEVAL